MRTTSRIAVVAIVCSACTTTEPRSAIPDATPSPAREQLVAPDRSIHARVRVPVGAHSEILEACGGAIREMSQYEVGEPGWWLVYMPPSYLDDLAVREHTEWREVPLSLLASNEPTETTANPSGDIGLFAIDGDPCKYTPDADEFCPYDLTTSTTDLRSRAAGPSSTRWGTRRPTTVPRSPRSSISA